MNLHLFDVKSIKNVELRLNAFKTTQNYKSNQITMTCIDLMSKHSKTKVIKIQRLASISCQTDQNNSKLQKRSNYNELHRFDVNTIKNVEYVAKHSKLRKTTKVIKLWQFASIWRQNDQKCWIRSQNNQNNAKLQKWSYNDEFASISCQNDQNNSKLQKRSNYNELHRFDVT